MPCNSLIVSTDLQFAMPGDEIYDGGLWYEGGYVILTKRHAQAVINEAEDIGWDSVNECYEFYCGALVRARTALSR
jgi:hypothetical protein